MPSRPRAYEVGASRMCRAGHDAPTEVVAIVIVGLLLATLVGASDVPTGESRPRWELSAAVLTGSPAVLDSGVALGAQAEVQRHLATRPFFGSLRLGWALASAANPSWIIDHHQLQAALGVGATKMLGAGRLWLQGGGGVGGVYEVLSRHQIERISAAGVPGGRESSLSLGPQLFAEAGLSVQLRGSARGMLALGPWLFRTDVDGAALTRAGLFARLGVAYEL